MWAISIGQIQFTIKNGSLIPLLILLPNFIWMAFPPESFKKGQVSEPIWVTIIENIGRLAAMILPFFFVLDFRRRFSLLVIVVMVFSLAFYYIGWVRYFSGGRSFALLKAPLLWVPIPMAVFPVVFLLLSSYLMNSWTMFAAAVIFGIAHLWISALGT